MAVMFDYRELPFYDEWMSPAPTVELHTSGSTGKPSRFVAEKKRMEASARLTCGFLGLGAGHRALLCMSTDYVGGKMMVVRAATCGLDLVCVEPSGHPLADVGDEPFDFVAMVPLQVYNSLHSPAERRRLEAIRHLIIGGGPIDAALAAEIKTLGNAVWSTYGMTETLSHVALRRLSGPEAEEWYTPFAGVNITLDADGRIKIDAPDVCREPLLTNDMGVIHPDGRRFKVLGRYDNVVCSGGCKFQIEEIESLLAAKTPGPVIVTKRSDQKFGEAVVLLYSSGDEADMRAACAAALPKYMRPKTYIKLPELPYAAPGKPARAAALKIAASYRP